MSFRKIQFGRWCLLAMAGLTGAILPCSLTAPALMAPALMAQSLMAQSLMAQSGAGQSGAGQSGAGQSGAGQPADRIPGGLQAAAALEQLLIDSIALCDKSVVAIARVRRAAAADGELLDPLLAPISAPDPTDPDFVPNEFGAGVVLSEDGLILTTHHVVGDPGRPLAPVAEAPATDPPAADRPADRAASLSTSDYYVWSQRKPYRARVVAADPWFDLAVLKIDAAGMSPMPLGDGKRVRKGQFVVALGNPHAIARDGQASASWGIISNVLRRAPASRAPASRDNATRRPGPSSIHEHGTLLQTDAKLNTGFSGGALINLRGQMVGLNVAFAAAPGFEAAAGFAIPVDDSFRRVIERLKQGQAPEFGFLGVEPQMLSAELRRSGLHGAKVTQVLPATPAARAGLKAGDLITHIEENAVHHDDDLVRLVSSLPPGRTANVTILRGNLDRGQTRQLNKRVLLSKKHTASLRPPFSTAPQPQWRGMRVDYPTAVPGFDSLAHRLDPAGCVYVGSVERDSAAWNAGLREGMWVTHVLRRRISTPDEFFAAVEGETGDLRLRAITADGERVVRTVSP